MIKKPRVITLIFLFVIFSSFILFQMSKQQRSIKEDTSKNVEPSPTIELSSWVVDWQWETGVSQLNEISDSLESIQLFAGYFNEEEEIVFTDEFNSILDNVTMEEEQDVYLTIVNDLLKSDGETVQKSPQLISNLLKTEESKNGHIDKIVELVNTYHLDGVEIDYENVKESEWNTVTSFYSDLYERLNIEGIKLRVVLEPSIPFDKLSLPEGPTYVVMAYNLFGYHSEPGPKANEPFIDQLINKMESIPKPTYLAFSTGGFEWVDNEEVRAISEQEADELSQLSREVPKRDRDSGTLFFTYEKDNAKHEVWYADSLTIEKWLKLAAEKGVTKFAIWRLGDLSEEMLASLEIIRQKK